MQNRRFRLCVTDKLFRLGLAHRIMVEGSKVILITVSNLLNLGTWYLNWIPHIRLETLSLLILITYPALTRDWVIQRKLVMLGYYLINNIQKEVLGWHRGIKETLINYQYSLNKWLLQCKISILPIQLIAIIIKYQHLINHHHHLYSRIL